MKLYVCHNEHNGGSFIGTISEIQEFIFENEWDFNSCEYYELGKKVKVTMNLKVEE